MSEVRLADRSSARRAAWQLRRSLTTAIGLATSGSRATPDFLVIGAQRAGTTSLHRYLASHPRIDGPRQTKGVHWFDTHWDRTRRWYRAHFPVEQSGHHTFESSPYYLFHPDVPRRVVGELPGIRVVVVLRDPVSRTWSHYHHELARGNEHLGFQEALEAEPMRLAGVERRLLADPLLVDDHHLFHAYVARSTYAPQLQRWYDAIGQDQVLVVDSADLRADTAATCDRVVRFIGLDPQPLDLTVVHNARRYPVLNRGTRVQLRARFHEADQNLVRVTGRRFSWMEP